MLMLWIERKRHKQLHKDTLRKEALPRSFLPQTPASSNARTIWDGQIAESLSTGRLQTFLLLIAQINLQSTGRTRCRAIPARMTPKHLKGSIQTSLAILGKLPAKLITSHRNDMKRSETTQRPEHPQDFNASRVIKVQRTPQAPTGATSQESMVLRFSGASSGVGLRITRRKMSQTSFMISRICLQSG